MLYDNGALLASYSEAALATGEPLFVVKLDAPGKRVIVGPREALGVNRITLKDVNWIGEPVASEDELGGREILVRVRSTRPPVPARLAIGAGWHVLLDAPEEGVAPGQAAVFYEREGSRVLGGGWIGATA
ncbi:MAG: aminomethyltransferase beta-barrel domain-containing protein, partial [Pseudomonadota bacterium]